MPSRRAYLATLAAAGVAGCVGGPPGTASPPSVTIEAAAVQYAYRHIENVDWNGIQSADGQFVFVVVDASEVEPFPERAAFTLVADAAYDPEPLEHEYPVDLDVPDAAYDPEEGGFGRQGLVFDVPAQLATAPTLRLDHDTGTWEARLDTEKATAPPPAWDWTATAPETVPPDATFDITVTAENVGDGPGTFRGAVNFSYPMYRPKGFDVVLASGDSGAATIAASSTDADPGTTLEYGVRTPTGKATVTVTVEAESTATESA